MRNFIIPLTDKEAQVLVFKQLKGHIAYSVNTWFLNLISYCDTKSSATDNEVTAGVIVI